MPTKFRRYSLPASSIALALIALTGCTDAKPISPPKPTVEPVFASEEEALAAVTETYEEYLRVSNTILVEGGTDSGRIGMIVGDDLVVSELESFSQLSTQGKTLIGAPRLMNLKLATWYGNPDAAGVLATALACIDLREVQVVGPDGNSSVQPDRPKTRTWSIHVGSGQSQQSEYVLIDRSFVSEGELCES